MYKFTKAASAVVISGLLTVSAMAMSAKAAKNEGLVAEDCHGYVHALKDEGKAVAKEINDKRRAKYARLASAEKVPVEVVAEEAGKKVCGK